MRTRKKQYFDEITYNLTVVSEDFKEMVEKPFKLSLVESNGTLQFETKIPEYIFQKAKELWPEDYDMEFIRKKRNEQKYGNLDWILKRAETRVLTYPNLEGIKSELWELSHKIHIHETFTEKEGDKVILIHFRGAINNDRFHYNGAGMGIENNINFQYFIAYHYIGQQKKWLSDEMITVEQFKSYYKRGVSEQDPYHAYKDTELKVLHTTSQELRDFKNYWIVVPWTEERENYLKAIQSNFITLTEKLNEFLKDLTEEKLDRLIENHPVGKFLTSGNTE